MAAKCDRFYAAEVMTLVTKAVDAAIRIRARCVLMTRADYVYIYVSACI